MKEFERALIAWSKGNKRGKLDNFWFTPSAVFVDGEAVCVRFRDLAARPVIFARYTVDFDAARFFKGRRWKFATPDEFTAIPNNFAVVEDMQNRARERWQRISNSELHLLGETLLSLLDYREKSGLDLIVTDLRHEDKLILGARFLLTGKAAALCEIPDEWSTWEKSYRIFEDFGDAMLFKLKNNGVKLHDLT